MWWIFRGRQRQNQKARRRVDVRENGAISAGWWREHCACTICDISEGGAGAELVSEEPLPRVVTLFLPARRMSAKVRTVWQRGRRAGFQYLE